PVMGGEDFSYMLEARPGAFIFVGNGDSPGLHHPRYNFNDDVIPYGTSYWVRLVETAMAGSGARDGNHKTGGQTGRPQGSRLQQAMLEQRTARGRASANWRSRAPLMASSWPLRTAHNHWSAALPCRQRC